MKTWIDENTGRRIRQLTDFPEGASLPYFRCPRHLPDGVRRDDGWMGVGCRITTRPTGAVRCAR